MAAENPNRKKQFGFFILKQRNNVKNIISSLGIRTSLNEDMPNNRLH